MGAQAELEGRRVLVTGSSRGIGRATARAFARAGARVAVHYHRAEALGQETLRGLPGEGHTLVAGDVSDPRVARRIVDECVERLGGLDVLVNSAAIFEEHPITGVDYARWQEVWRRTLEVNLLGPAWLCWCAAQAMLGSGGRIVNVSSRGAFRGEPDQPAYGASKGGLNAMSQSLARALAPRGILVFVVAPGWVETDMSASALSVERERILGQMPMGRLTRADEVAEVVVFLASGRADQCTGTIVDVNGASYLRT